MGLKIEAGCGMQRKLELGCGMRSSSRDRDTQFSRSGYGMFWNRWRDKGSQKWSHLMTEKTPNNDNLYERNNNLCISALPVTYNQCIFVLDPLPASPFRQRSYNFGYFSHYSLEWVEWCWIRDGDAIGRKSWPFRALGCLKCNKMRCPVLRTGHQWQ